MHSSDGSAITYIDIIFLSGEDVTVDRIPNETGWKIERSYDILTLGNGPVCCRKKCCGKEAQPGDNDGGGQEWGNS